MITNAVRGWPHYYNYIDDQGLKDGVDLTPDLRWTLLHDDEEGEEDELAPHIPQLEGAEVTPDDSPEIIETGTRPKTGIRLGIGDYVNDSDSDHDRTKHRLNNALSHAASMEWDAYGTDFEDDVKLDRVQNLDMVLPLTSTPVDSLSTPLAPRRPRTSLPRRLLPLEREGDRDERSFLSKLNPFRKR